MTSADGKKWIVFVLVFQFYSSRKRNEKKRKRAQEDFEQNPNKMKQIEHSADTPHYTEQNEKRNEEKKSDLCFD